MDGSLLLVSTAVQRSTSKAHRENRRIFRTAGQRRHSNKLCKAGMTGVPNVDHTNVEWGGRKGLLKPYNLRLNRPSQAEAGVLYTNKGKKGAPSKAVRKCAAR